MKIEARRSKPMQVQGMAAFSAAGVLEYANVEKIRRDAADAWVLQVAADCS